MKNSYKFYWDTFLDGEILKITKRNDKGHFILYGPFIIDKENNIKVPFELIKELIEKVEDNDRV